MPQCPRCQRPVKVSAIQCPHCQLLLKAHGHPSIPLHRAGADEFLCDRCLYHHDDTCNLPLRPQARECTLFRDGDRPFDGASDADIANTYVRDRALQYWFQGNALWLLLLGFLLVGMLLAMS